MAQMFPETFSGQLQAGNPEYQVFNLLRGLPDYYSVIYSKKIKGSRSGKEEVEIDYIVFDGVKNLICLEVKGGEIAYNGERREWYQNGQIMERAPDRQASSSCHALIGFLGDDARNININWALAFPDCSRPAGSGGISEVPEELLLDAEALLDTPRAIARIFQYNELRFGRSGVGRYQANRIKDRLLRSVGFIAKLGTRLVQDARQIVRATSQQLEVLDDLELNPRTAVMGYAGTGKTIIATEFAKRCSEMNKRVLLLFYNRMVANSVRYGLGRDSPIECTTFHSLTRREIEAVDQSWWNENKNKDDPDFWEMTAPLKMLEVIESKEPEYDVIIVDEGQDFKSEWFEILGGLQRQEPDSRFVIFHDSNQDIFSRWSDLPWSPGTFTRKQLRKNCRNTKAIVNQLNEMLPSEMVAFEQSPDGQPVTILSNETIGEQAAAIRKDLEKLLKEGVLPGQIVILIDGPLKDSSVSQIDRIGKYKLSWMGRSYQNDSLDIQITTIESFKGLEADVILNVLNSSSYGKDTRKRYYTAASRARLVLHMFELSSKTS